MHHCNLCFHLSVYVQISLFLWGLQTFLIRVTKTYFHIMSHYRFWVNISWGVTTQHMTLSHSHHYINTMSFLSCQKVCSLPHFLHLSSFICTELFQALLTFAVPNMFPFTLGYNHANFFSPDDEWPVYFWFQWSVLNLYLFDAWWRLILFLIHFLYLASMVLMYLDFSQITLDASSQFFEFYFSVTVYIQYYFALLSGVQHNG